MTSPLEYRPPAMVTRPGRLQMIGASSVFIGSLSLLVNLLIAAALIGQLLKQWGYIPHGASRDPIEAWLMVTSVEAALSAAWSAFAIVIGALTLRRSSRGPALHIVYARVKLPLAIVFAACVGWGLPIYDIRTPQAIVAGVVLALMVGVAYPVVLLRTFSGRIERPVRRGTGSQPPNSC